MSEQQEYTAENDAYVRRENQIARIAQIIVDAGCKPYSAAAALVDAGYVIPPGATAGASGSEASADE